MAVTLKFLSEQCNLSVTSVSLILNGKEVRVADDKKQQVLKLAKEYNYMPNSLAVGLVTKKSKTVGLILPDITNSFFAEIARSLEQSFTEVGYSTILCNTNDKLNEENKYARLLYSKGVDALVVCPTIESMDKCEYVSEFIDAGKCVVAFDRYSPDMDCSTVTCDNYGGSVTAVNYLIGCGHRRIGCIAGSPNSPSAQKRINGYRDALVSAGIDIDESLIFFGDYQFNSGYSCGKQLLQKDITAVFVCNDLMAYGFYRAAKELGKKIPEDVSVMGFDDLFFSSMLDVPLSSVRQNTDALANTIFDLVSKALTKSKSPVKHIVLDTQISLRDSVKTISD